MAQTTQELIDGYKTNPDYQTLTQIIDGEPVELTPAERDARFAEWAANERRLQLDAERDAGERTEFSQARAVYQKLKAGTATSAETQKFVAMIGKHIYRMKGEEADGGA